MVSLFAKKRHEVHVGHNEMIAFYAQLISLKTYLLRDELDLEQIEEARSTLLKSEILQADEFKDLAKWLKNFKPSKKMDLSLLSKVADNLKV